MKKLLTGLLSLTLLLGAASIVKADKPSDLGLDDTGYNWTANLFNGTGYQWCLEKYGWNTAACDDFLGIYAGDSLIMKWNEEWNRGNREGWSNPPYKAWENNEWNGMNGGSGAVWHYKIIWVGPELESSVYWRPGGYAIWGQFEVIMDQGVDPSLGDGHLIFAHGIPTGYGGY